jgi:hypothetical protein
VAYRSSSVITKILEREKQHTRSNHCHVSIIQSRYTSCFCVYPVSASGSKLSRLKHLTGWLIHVSDRLIENEKTTCEADLCGTLLKTPRVLQSVMREGM